MGERQVPNETKLGHLWPPARQSEEVGRGLDIFQGSSSTSFAVCSLRTRVSEVQGIDTHWVERAMIGFHPLEDFTSFGLAGHARFVVYNERKHVLVWVVDHEGPRSSIPSDKSENGYVAMYLSTTSRILGVRMSSLVTTRVFGVIKVNPSLRVSV
jgi:hypothetical protein